MSEVVFIGTSDAFGAGGRRQSAVFVRGERGGMLLDCGATTNTGLSQLGLSRNEIDVILISHFHGDHFGGIPAFLYASLYTDRRRHPIEIVGPPEVEARIRALARALGHNLERPEWTYPIHYREIRANESLVVGPAEVHAFATEHQPESHPQGYRVQLGREQIAYSGDTGWFDELPREVAGADLFLCECTQVDQTFEFHLSLEELADRRSSFDVGDLILTHLGEKMRTLTDYLGFDIADDGRIVKL